MKINHSDILFGLYMNGGKGTMDWLVEFLCNDAAPDAGEIQEIKDCIGVMAALGFIQSSWEDDHGYFTITEQGNRAALAAADMIAGQMVDQWRQTYVA